MERRLFKRIAFGVKAEITLHGKRFEVIIEDLSETGANIITGLIDDASDFVQGAEMELKFKPVTEELLTLNGKIQWVQKAYPNSNMYKVGVILLNPPWDESGFFL